MNYFKVTMAYLFKNGKGKQFFVFALFALIPCAVAAYYFPISKMVSWFFNFQNAAEVSWSSLWLGFFPSSLTGNIISFVAVGLFVFSEAAITTMISRHLRTGVFYTKGIVRSINENFFPALYSCIGFIFVVITTFTVLSLLLFMWTLVNVKIVGTIAAILTVVFVGGVFIYMWATTNLWLPIMSFNGLNFIKSFSVAFYKSRISQRLFFIPYLVIIGIVVGIGVGAYFIKYVRIVSYILTLTSYIFASVFIISFNFISYFEVEALPREDLARLYRSK